MPVGSLVAIFTENPLGDESKNYLTSQEKVQDILESVFPKQDTSRGIELLDGSSGYRVSNTSAGKLMAKFSNCAA